MDLQCFSMSLPLKDTAELRSTVLQAFQTALWSAKVTFRETDYQQIRELECRHLTLFLRAASNRALWRERLVAFTVFRR